MTFQNTKVSSNDKTTHIGSGSMGTELMVAIILFVVQCSIFWCVFLYAKRKLYSNTKVDKNKVLPTPEQIEDYEQAKKEAEILANANSIQK